MGLPAQSNLTRSQPAQSGSAQNPMQGIMQMLSMVRQMRAANGGQSPFGGKAGARTQQATPQTLPMQRPMMPMPSMPQASPFVPVQQPAPRVLTPPAVPVVAPEMTSAQQQQEAGLAKASPQYADVSKLIGPTAAYQSLFGYG